MKLIDIHCHLLPRIDDGARDKAESLLMLKEMAKQNVCAFIATPHYRQRMFETDPNEVITAFQWIREEALKLGIRAYLGTECYIDSDIFTFIDKKLCRTMVGSSYILAEFSTFSSYAEIRKRIYALKNRKLTPIIAHVERVDALINDITKIEDLISLGARIQINAGSLIGEDGWNVKRKVKKLVKADLIHFIASDSHRIDKRTQNLEACEKIVSKTWGESYSKKIFYENPVKVITNKPI